MINVLLAEKKGVKKSRIQATAKPVLFIGFAVKRTGQGVIPREYRTAGEGALLEDGPGDCMAVDPFRIQGQ